MILPEGLLEPFLPHSSFSYVSRNEVKMMRRISIDFSDQAFEELGRISRRLNVTKAGALRKALGLIKYVLEEREAGGKLFIENKSQKVKKEIVTL